jgi:RNA polymerase sigma factor (sigma-70 family)
MISMTSEHELVEQHVGLAQVIALDYFNIPGTSLDEAISEAHMALIRASKGFNPTKGEFAPYAARAIRNCLNTLYAKQLKMARLFPKSLDDPPIPSAKREGISSSDVQSRVTDSRQDVRKAVSQRETYSILTSVLKTLSPREQIVIEHIRLGRSLAEIGSLLGVSKQAVHNVSAPALIKLREKLKATGYHGLDSMGHLKSLSSSHLRRVG